MRSGGRFDRGEGDFHAGVEPFDLTDFGAGLALGDPGAVVAGAEVGEAGGRVGDEDAGDLADDPGYRDDGFLLPRRLAVRRYCSPRRVSVLAADITDCPNRQ